MRNYLHILFMALLWVAAPTFSVAQEEGEEEINRFFREKDWIPLNQALGDPASVKKLYVLEAQSLDLESLKKFPHITGLIIEDTPVENLDFLADFPNLTILELPSTGLRSLKGVEKLINLTDLAADHNFITDITPLEGLIHLRELRLYENRLTDISALRNLTELQHLDLGKNQIRSLEPITRLTRLKAFSIYHNTTVGSLEPVRNFAQLRDLNISLLDKPEFSLELIARHTELRNLRIQGMVRSNEELKHLAGMKNLEQLTMGINDNVTDISALQGLDSLKYLDIHSNNVTSIAVIEKLPNLIKLVMYRNKVADISPVKNCPNLRSLFMFENPIADYEPLYLMRNLQYLHLSAKDFPPDKSLRLRKALRDTRITFI